MVSVSAASPRLTQRQQQPTGWFEPALSIPGVLTPTLNRMRVDNGFFTYKARFTVNGTLPGAVLSIGFLDKPTFTDDQIAGEVIVVDTSGSLTAQRLRASYGANPSLVSVAALPGLSTGWIVHVSASWLI